MPTPGSQQISLSDTPFYRCISRCVRRTFLCGTDRVTNKDYSHRKQWIIERLALLSNTFAIDVLLCCHAQSLSYRAENQCSTCPKQA